MSKSIWFNPNLSLSDFSQWSKNTMGEFLEISFHEIGPDYLIAKMPVTSKTRQPYGILHGGASVALAETVGSIASALVIDHQKQKCVGLEINANHIKSIKEGWVFAKANPLHLGRSTHVWDIKITNENGDLVCVCRLTVAILH